MKSDWLETHLPDAIDEALNEADSVRFEKQLSEDPQARARFEALRRLADMTRRLPTHDEPVDFTADVMHRIQNITHPWWVRLWYLLIRPREVRVNILGALSGAAGLAVAAVLVVYLPGRMETAIEPATLNAPQQYVMRFTYNDPHARQVYVAGSFNNWQKEQIPLTDQTNRGTWTRLVPMEPGLYEYMFYVDGHWVADDYALHFKDDGFGRKNAILALGIGDDVSM